MDDIPAKNKDIAIVFDCGATNLRVIAINTKGVIEASEAAANETDDDPFFPGGRIWNLGKLWGKFCGLSDKVMKQINRDRIAGVTVTTFGVDGAFIDKNDDLLYPVISWQCSRTQSIVETIDQYCPVERLYEISGVFPYAFNTINKMIWFRENRPDVLEKADRFLFMPSLFLNKLGGCRVNDATMLGTSMLMDLKSRSLSEEILTVLKLSPALFGTIGEPGDRVGEVSPEAARLTGLPERTPLFLAGHDTQFAIFGSGAELKQPVLSSGTWEILMARSNYFTASRYELEEGITTEADAEAGIYTIGQNWLGSGVLEWFTRHFYSGLKGDQLYETLIKEAEEVEPGEHGLMIDPSFFKNGDANGGKIHGLTIHTSRGQIGRAILESLAFRLREGLEKLQTAGRFSANQIICVGGGSKNRLWNQIRADVCNTPICLIDQKETTVLGAALFVFAGAGCASNVHEARKNIPFNPNIIEPSEKVMTYEKLYQRYITFKDKLIGI
ncbi:L-fuculokinase [Thermophagus sp. OGC60D27]|uniref:L-fuculokinase n=1 Tax=Thermophagus sp. OGC60D27 TaxID=3458415 RepID=UPI0040383780